MDGLRSWWGRGLTVGVYKGVCHRLQDPPPPLASPVILTGQLLTTTVSEHPQGPRCKVLMGLTVGGSVGSRPWVKRLGLVRAAEVRGSEGRRTDESGWCDLETGLGQRLFGGVEGAFGGLESTTVEDGSRVLLFLSPRLLFFDGKRRVRRVDPIFWGT